MAALDDGKECPHCGSDMKRREDLSTTYFECEECGHTEDEHEHEDDEDNGDDGNLVA